MGSQERPLQHSAVELQPKPCGRQAQMLPEQKPLQHGPQEPPFDRHAAQVPLSQILVQHSLSASQEPPFGRHIGVVVEVVLVDVEVVLVEVAGVSVVEGLRLAGSAEADETATALRVPRAVLPGPLTARRVGRSLTTEAKRCQRTP